MIVPQNDSLKEIPIDNLYHFGLSSDQPLKHQFGDVRFVCMGGSTTRMEAFAKEAGVFLKMDASENISTTDRFCLYKTGPLLIVNHGMGGPSVSIMLHEITKLLHYAEARAVYIRMGTSGGVGVPPGSVVVSQKVFNGFLQNTHTIAVLGEPITRPAYFSEVLARDISNSISDDLKSHIIEGNTLSCDDFYEGQGRRDGALCSYTPEAKLAFLQRAHALGIRNIEMEGLVLSSFCNALNIPAAMICVTLLDRLLGDQIGGHHPDTSLPQQIVLAYVKAKLSSP